MIRRSTVIGIMLAISGGLMDAYSYLYRGEVFANAQTGNILLLGVNLMNGDIGMALRYLCPILCFVAGIVISLSINRFQLAIFLGAVIFNIVCLIPQSHNLVANSLISLVCGIQLEGFKKIRNNNIATTMCIGNLKSMIEHLYLYISTGNKQLLTKSLLYLLIIVSFIIGAIIGSIAIQYMQQNALLICSCLLLTVAVFYE